jgi:hypothetical protein
MPKKWYLILCIFTITPLFTKGIEYTYKEKSFEGDKHGISKNVAHMGFSTTVF